MSTLQEFKPRAGSEPLGYIVRFRTDDPNKATINRVLLWANNGADPGSSVLREAQTTLECQTFFNTLEAAYAGAWWWKHEAETDAECDVVPLYGHPFGQTDPGEIERRIDLPIEGMGSKKARATMRVIDGGHYIVAYAPFNLKGTAFDGGDQISELYDIPYIQCFTNETDAHAIAKQNKWDPAYVRIVEVLIGLPATPEQSDDEQPRPAANSDEPETTSRGAKAVRS